MVSFPLCRRALSLLSVVSAALLLAGCGRPLPPAAYRTYLADPAHGLTHTVVANGATVTCTYRPLDLLVLQDLAGGAPSTPAARATPSCLLRHFWPAMLPLNWGT